MKFTLEGDASPHLIRGYSREEIRVGRQIVRASCIVTGEQLITDWEPICFEALEPRHLAQVFELHPELVLAGTGPQQRFASPAVRAAFADARIALECMDLGAACRTFNVLVQEERRVAALLFLQ
jgi:uncharacterized protein